MAHSFVDDAELELKLILEGYTPEELGCKFFDLKTLVNPPGTTDHLFSLWRNKENVELYRMTNTLIYKFLTLAPLQNKYCARQTSGPSPCPVWSKAACTIWFQHLS
jgi:hypothetical protein